MTAAPFRATITQVVPLFQAGVQAITLKVPANFSHKAGQYLLVHHPGGVDMPMSIASAPHELPELTLHYRSNPGDPTAAAMDALLQQWQDTSADLPVDVSPAQGTCLCPEDNVPFLIVAAGTGASQGFACAAARAGQALPTDFLWCAQHENDLYELETLEALPGLQLITQVDPEKHDNNAGMQWLKSTDLAAYANILIAGSPEFVYAVTDVLVGLGIPQSRLMADAYSYAPRT